MELFDQLKEQALGRIGAWAAEQGPLAQKLLETVQGKELGSLSGLVEQFKSKGLGDVVKSWVGTGANLPVTPEQLEAVLGKERIQALAAKFGVPPELAGEKLAELLPKVIDKLTPNGRVEEASR